MRGPWPSPCLVGSDKLRSPANSGNKQNRPCPGLWFPSFGCATRLSCLPKFAPASQVAESGSFSWGPWGKGVSLPLAGAVPSMAKPGHSVSWPLLQALGLDWKSAHEKVGQDAKSIPLVYLLPPLPFPVSTSPSLSPHPILYPRPFYYPKSSVQSMQSDSSIKIIGFRMLEIKLGF